MWRFFINNLWFLSPIYKSLQFLIESFEKKTIFSAETCKKLVANALLFRNGPAQLKVPTKVKKHASKELLNHLEYYVEQNCYDSRTILVFHFPSAWSRCLSSIIVSSEVASAPFWDLIQIFRILVFHQFMQWACFSGTNVNKIFFLSENVPHKLFSTRVQENFCLEAFGTFLICQVLLLNFKPHVCGAFLYIFLVSGSYLMYGTLIIGLT